jgi:hypothetical protein
LPAAMRVCVSSLGVFLSASSIHVRLQDKMKVPSLPFVGQGERLDALVTVFLRKLLRYITLIVGSEVGRFRTAIMLSEPTNP